MRIYKCDFCCKELKSANDYYFINFSITKGKRKVATQDMPTELCENCFKNIENSLARMVLQGMVEEKNKGSWKVND